MSSNVLSPIPGIFFRQPSPEEPVFINEGDVVKVGDVIGLVEVMKNYYEVKSEVEGVLTKFLANDEDLLEAGQVIASID